MNKGAILHVDEKLFCSFTVLDPVPLDRPDDITDRPGTPPRGGSVCMSPVPFAVETTEHIVETQEDRDSSSSDDNFADNEYPRPVGPEEDSNESSSESQEEEDEGDARPGVESLIEEIPEVRVVEVPPDAHEQPATPEAESEAAEDDAAAPEVEDEAAGVEGEKKAVDGDVEKEVVGVEGEKEAVDGDVEKEAAGVQEKQPE
jgi:hypothetical protein